MATMYCALCRRPVEGKRQIGVGTVFLAVITGGFSLLAVPFYKKRCSICKSEAVSALPPGSGYGPGSADPRTVELEEKLRLAQDELESVNAALDRVRTERDFYRQLLEDPAARAKRRLGKE